TVAVDEIRLGNDTWHYGTRAFLPALATIAHNLGYPYSSRVTVQVRNADCVVLEGQKIVARGKLCVLEGERKESAQLFVSDMSVEGDGAWASRTIATIDASLSELLDSRPAHAQGLVPGVALGDDTRVNTSLSQAMQTTGLTHLIAVSGGHVSILLAIVFSVVGKRRPIFTALLSLGVLAALVVLVGAQASVVRAFLMSLVVLGAFARGRLSQATPAWALAVIVASIFNPWLALSYGFLLSASATIGIVLVGVPLGQHLQAVLSEYARKIGCIFPKKMRGQNNVYATKIRRHGQKIAVGEKLTTFLSQAVAIPLVAQIFCLPILLLFSTQSSLWSVVTNALVAPVVAPLTVFGLLAALCAPIFPTLAALFLYPAQICTWWIDVVARSFADFYGSGIPVWLAGLFFLLLLGATLAARRAKLVAVMITPFFLLIGTQWALQPHVGIPDDWQIIQCDVGQGSALLARIGTEVAMVDVGGNDSGVEDCLTQAKVTHIDLLILSHMHDDHIGGLAEVTKIAHIKQIWVSPDTEPSENWEKVKKTAQENNISIETVWYEHAWKDAVRIISPRKSPSGDPNADSLVVYINIGGGVLIMGDADGEIQIPIAARVEKIHTIVVAHHGSSRQEEALAAATQPEIALISVGENSYGHPSAKALHTYGMAAIYDTRTCGTIALTDTGVFSACAQPVG
ncbi:MAG: ComEC/Rec2 family competence protein, partial [Actinomycetaceae bacterium]|nr:ComEC/Rec2 family competence protein [Actinomycetaceae bacterium]